MTPKKNSKSDEEQSRSFIETARKLECDESEERFDEALKKVAKAPPHKKTKADDERK